MADSRPTSAFHVTNIGVTPTDRLIGALDAQADSAGVRRLRAWAHAAVAARPGERVVDVGSGTGSETQVLAAAVGPTGEVLGVEPHDGLRAAAELRAAAAGSAARFVAGDAVALPLDDAGTDVVWCERVFQHLAEPAKAVGEIVRVLRPGGRVVLLDTDWATSLLYPGDPQVVAALMRRALKAAANPHAGRQLVGLLATAGLEITDVGSQALIQSNTEVNWQLIRMLGESALREELISEQQRDALYTDLTSAADEGALHMSVTMFGVAARRPSA
ncbi:methyltransferase domain-containing protein [Streptomyces sp. SPB162]|uniref:methyltransferase domain-containing protein n=1 Tax=Streptomyces sp. SPB162 TaxID=2940560 RepID=UPI0024049242|nr:methyltransferase domain-containing protein [Streptomyces sp. SPB162]MDF9810918.1 ubiquinone/menaquinone biosynthesis C-methylase UbiE [Streptomyces sp. SPB162]